MRWLGALLSFGIFAALTGGAYMASAAGWGLPGTLDQPVSVRQQSVGQSRRAGGPMFLFLFLFLGCIAAHLFQMIQISLRNIPGHILTVEYRCIKALQLAISLAHRKHEIFQLLIHEPVGSDRFCNFVDVTAVGN